MNKYLSPKNENVPQNFSQGDKLSPSDQILAQTLSSVSSRSLGCLDAPGSNAQLEAEAPRELKQRPRRRQRERQKAVGLDKPNNTFARAARFLIHFFAVVARLRRETA